MKAGGVGGVSSFFFFFFKQPGVAVLEVGERPSGSVWMVEVGNYREAQGVQQQTKVLL